VGTSRRWYDAWLRFLYWFTAFSSAALLFLIQPVLAKALLPHFGGSASVWTAALFFFQAMVVLGYLWAFAIERLSPLAGRLLHVGILLLSMLWLPIHPVLPAAGDPLLSVLLTLVRNAFPRGDSLAGLCHFEPCVTGGAALLPVCSGAVARQRGPVADMVLGLWSICYLLHCVGSGWPVSACRGAACAGQDIVLVALGRVGGGAFSVMDGVRQPS
jgi:hypothetical protein